MESDHDYRNRLVDCDGVGVMWAEDIANSFKEELDDIGELFNCPRKNSD